MSTSIYKISDFDFHNLIENKIRRAIVPVGSLEQHGAHLPLSTDSLITEHIATKVVEKMPSFILPAMSYGVSYEHKPKFNLSIHNSTLSSVIYDICISLVENGIESIVLLNGHYGNMGVLQYIGQNVYGKVPENIRIFSINYWHMMQHKFDHAGEVETSLVLAISPELVKMEKAEPNSKRIFDSKIMYSSVTNNPGSFLNITGNGVWGDPRNANAQRGRSLLNEIVKNLVHTINELESNTF
ncbi:MAG TPA: creatininase family protein [Nitrososphaeraceae archaeon]|nr:creatininase family protein [Nitrososphaeraceae archaeon]